VLKIVENLWAVELRS